MEKSIGERLKELRQKEGKTQAELATALNSTAQVIYTYEKGRDPGAAMLLAYAKHFGVTVDYLLGLEELADPTEAAAKRLGLSKAAAKNLLHVTQGELGYVMDAFLGCGSLNGIVDDMGAYIAALFLSVVPTLKEDVRDYIINQPTPHGKRSVDLYKTISKFGMKEFMANNACDSYKARLLQMAQAMDKYNRLVERGLGSTQQTQ